MIPNTHYATIQRVSYPAASSSNFGTPDPTWSDVYSDVGGNLHPLPDRAFPTRSELRDQETGKRDLQRSHVFYTHRAFSLQTGDRLLIGSTYYQVISWADMAGMGKAYSIFLKESN